MIDADAGAASLSRRVEANSQLWKDPDRIGVKFIKKGRS